jgi:hypothetical protein
VKKEKLYTKDNTDIIANGCFYPFAIPRTHGSRTLKPDKSLRKH